MFRLLFCLSVGIGRTGRGRNTGWGFSTKDAEEDMLEYKGRGKGGMEKNYIARTFMTCTFRQIFE
jgi:hypothetical protein